MSAFAIGETVYRATYDRHAKWVTCPDCLGSKHVKVVLGDLTEVVIDCGGCDPGGYEPSKGVICQYDYVVAVTEHKITGVRISLDKQTEYELEIIGQNGHYIGRAGDTFRTKDEALSYGEQMKSEYESDENKRLMAKTKNHKTWAWNASYHRQCAERARKDFEYHSNKAKICKDNVKTDPKKEKKCA